MELESLIQVLRSGTPCAAYNAGRELIACGRSAEAPLVHLLRELSNPHQILDVLGILREIRISATDSVDSVVRLLSHQREIIRRAAAYCLLDSSPKLRRQLPQLRVVLAREKDATVRTTLEKLLERYPETKS